MSQEERKSLCSTEYLKKTSKESSFNPHCYNNKTNISNTISLMSMHGMCPYMVTFQITINKLRHHV